MQKLEKDLVQGRRKLANADFLAKAPPEVVQKEQDRVRAGTEKLHKLQHHRDRLKEFLG